MEHLEVARAQSPRGEVVLRERRESGVPPVLELRVNGVFVMDTLETTSERALAHAALELVELVEHPARVLVGGLGLGYTVLEVLADPRVGACVVVEVEQAVVDWMRDGTIPHGPELLADDRVHVVVGDVATVLAEADEAAYDLVLLDVDNGPDNLVHEANATLYREPFLQVAGRATGQLLVIWSAAEAPALQASMEAVFGNVTAAAYDVRLGVREDRYWLYSAHK